MTALAPVIEKSPTKGVKVDASIVARPFRDEIKAKVQELKTMGIEAPLLVGLLANKDPAARKYAEWTGRAAQADGLRYELRSIDNPVDVETALLDANDDPRVHGIIVYYPIFGQEESFSGASQDDYLRDSVSYKCDVEGLCHSYRTNLYRNVRYLDYPANTKKCLLPCTALSVVKILEHCPGCYDTAKPIGRRMEGNTVTIINRSEIVGRPLAAMLANDGADVYSIDIESIYLFRQGRRLLQVSKEETPESCIRKSTVVVTGVPSKEYRLDTTWIQPNTTVVNVASFKNVDEDALLLIPGVVYVPMVGKVTVAMLERNLMRLFDNFHHPYHQQEQKKEAPWYGSVMQLYTAIAVTALLAVQVVRGK
jgi:methylenetetrahydrofolate dehydrogenase (NAD+)